MPDLSHLPSYVVPILVIVVVMGLRMRRMTRPRRLRLETLWILPAILLLGTVASLVAQPPKALQWIGPALAVLLGGGLGWLRGRLTPIAIDPETHALNSRISPAGMAFLVLLFLLRFGARTAVNDVAPGLHIPATLIANCFLVFAASLISLTRLEMGLRARRLLIEARAARGIGGPWSSRRDLPRP